MTRHILLLVAACALSGCDCLVSDGCENEVVSLFESDFVAEATPDRATYDQTIEIRATVTPTFSGTGAFVLRYSGSGRTAAIISPAMETIGGIEGSSYRAEFEEGVPETVTWEVRLNAVDGRPGEHGFPLVVFADSVEVEGALLPAESREAQDAYGSALTSADHYPLLTLD